MIAMVTAIFAIATAGWLWVAAFCLLAAPSVAIWSNQSKYHDQNLNCHCSLAVRDCILDTGHSPLTAR